MMDPSCDWGGSHWVGSRAHSCCDSSAVRNQLVDVQQIQASCGAFAAILGGDGSVVTWGVFGRGGDSSAVQDQLRDVQQIQASRGAFAAILADGSVVTWGNVRFFGDCSTVQDQQQIQAAAQAFAAILGDGSVVTWGRADCGGDSRAVQEQLTNVQQIQASESICCNPGRWICGHLGLWLRWRRQQCGTGAAARCTADPSLCFCVCCNPGRWICRHLGSCRLLSPG